MSSPFYICLDFDGTVVKHAYPNIGEDIGARSVLWRLISERNAHLILFTMRSGQALQEAVQWFFDHGIPLSGINTNPTQSAWTNSPKAYGHLYIDDAAIGCPLIYPENERPYVDWKAVETIIFDHDKKGLHGEEIKP